MDASRLKAIIGFRTTDGALCLRCAKQQPDTPRCGYVMEGDKGVPCQSCRHKVQRVYRDMRRSIAIAEAKVLYRDPRFLT